MLDLQSLVQTLKRPSLLVRAARFGLDDYRRDRDLRRIFKTEHLPQTGSALIQLLERETALNDLRMSVASDYSTADHIALLTAITGEERLLQDAYRPSSATT